MEIENQIFIMNHPLIKHKISILRNKNTNSKEFRELISEITMLMCFESLRELPLKKISVETPLEITQSYVLEDEHLAFVPILRAGIGMVDGILNLLPTARVGHIGLFRDPSTFKPCLYYNKFPKDMSKKDVIVLDPMLATGGSAIEAISVIKKENPKKIRFMCILSCPEGIDALTKAHPDVKIYCAGKDERLNDKAYILPGLGDAGDRIFGTK